MKVSNYTRLNALAVLRTISSITHSQCTQILNSTRIHTIIYTYNNTANCFTYLFLAGLGLADLKGMCKQDTSCTLNKDTGLGTAFTLAHETAHK